MKKALSWMVAALTATTMSVSGEEMHADHDETPRRPLKESRRELVRRHRARKDELNIMGIAVESAGYQSQDDAAIAFYDHIETLYQATNGHEEVVGFLVVSPEGEWHFTDPVVVEADSFSLRAGIKKKPSWETRDTLHTHPADDNMSQEGFSKGDVKAVKKRETCGYYVRTPKGSIRHINNKTLRTTKSSFGAHGTIVKENLKWHVDQH